jgi:hypothetical protein
MAPRYLARGATEPHGGPDGGAVAARSACVPRIASLGTRCAETMALGGSSSSRGEPLHKDGRSQSSVSIK